MSELFENDQQQNDIDPNKDYYAELVGDGKKFKDNAALARGKAESDLFIQRLLKEQEELREELRTKTTEESIIDRLRALQSTPPREPDENTTPPSEQKGLTQEELEALLDKKLSSFEKTRLERNNMSFIEEKLVERFGSKEAAKAEIRRKAQALDVKPETMEQMAVSQPKVFLALFQDKVTEPSVPRNSVNSAMPSGSGIRDSKYWQELRKKDPVAYHSKELTIQRHNDAIKLGQAFFT